MTKTKFIFISLVALVGAVGFYEYQKMELEGQQKEQKLRVLSFLEGKTLERIQLKQSGDVITIVLDENGWNIKEPLVDRADNDYIVNWLDNIVGGTAITLEDESGQLAHKDKVELGKPLVDLMLKTKQGDFEITLWEKSTFDGKRYLTASHLDQVFLLESFFYNYFLKSVNEFRNRTLFPNYKEVSALKITYNNVVIDFLKDKGVWMFRAKPSLRLDPNAVEDLISHIRHLKAQSIVADNQSTVEKSQLKLPTKPTITLDINYVDLNDKDSKISFKVFSNGIDETYLLTNQLKPIFKVKAADLEPFKKDLEHYRNKFFPFQFHPGNEKYLNITRAQDKHPTRLYRPVKQWEMYDESPHAKVKRELVENSLERVRSFRVKYYVDATLIKKHLIHELTLNDSLQRNLFTLKWSDPQDFEGKKVIFAQTNLSEDGIVLNPEDIEFLTEVQFIEKENMSGN